MTTITFPRICVVTVTYYPDTNDIRFQLALQLCRLASRTKIHVIIVDDSPDESVRDQLMEAGNGFVYAVTQMKDAFSGKGGALRQAIARAGQLFFEYAEVVAMMILQLIENQN